MQLTFKSNYNMEDDQKTILVQMNKYQHLIRQLMSKMPKEQVESIMKNKQASNTIATGPASIWPCLDGWLVGIRNSFDNQIVYSFEIPSKLTMVELYNERNNEFLLFYDLASKFRIPGKSFTFNADISFNTNIIEIPIASPEGTHLIGQYSKIIFVGKDHPNSQWPEEHSLFDIKYATEYINLDGPNKAKELVTQFEFLLAESKREEDLQIFLNNHPEFIFADGFVA
jgi:hypothetical protein